MLQDFKPEIKLFFLVALIAVVISVAGILLLKGIGIPDTGPPQTYWQTYRNDELEFEVKYPEEWQVSMSKSAGPEYGVFIQFHDPKSDRIGRRQVNLHVSDSPTLTLEEYIKTYMVGRDYRVSSIEDTNIGRVPWKRVVITGGDVANEGPYISFLMLYREKIYRWDGTDQDTLAKILATFRFIE